MDYGPDEETVRRFLAKWWFYRLTFGLLGDGEHYIEDPKARAEALEAYKQLKEAGDIAPLTKEQHQGGFKAFSGWVK